MDLSIDIGEATDFLRSYRLESTMKLSAIHQKSFIKHEIPEKFEPCYWANASETLLFDFARLIKQALEDADNDIITYNSINTIVNCFECYCIVEKGILVGEIEKENELFGCLSYSEYDSIDVPFSNVTRWQLDLWLGIVLDRQRILEWYNTPNESIGKLICAAGLLHEDIANQYLLNILREEENLTRINIVSVIEILGENKVTSCFEIIFGKILDRFGSDLSVCFALVELAKNIQGDNLIKLLMKLKENYVAEHSTNKELETSIEVALCMLNRGEVGLLEFYENVEDYKTKYEIIHCYAFYHTKSYAQLLVDALNDPYHLENGYYPVRSNANNYLQMESSIKLIQWFGYDILDILYSTKWED